MPTRALSILLIGGLAVAAALAPASAATDACDGTDSDVDLLVDCQDNDCHGVVPTGASVACEFGCEIACGDTFDNDGDGSSDASDADCTGGCNDVDSDGIVDPIDKCTTDSRNVVSPCDCDEDGYGNVCDADYDQNNVVNAIDFAKYFVPAYKAPGSGCQIADHDCNESVNALDFSLYFVPKFKGIGGAVPGPTGLPCGGTIPCCAGPPPCP